MGLSLASRLNPIRRREGFPIGESALAPLFQSIRELMLNVVRHAKADTIEIEIESDGDTVSVHVRDDGLGFDPHNRGPDVIKSNGFGLFGIRDRFQMFGGGVEIASSPGKGTIVSLFAPLDAVRADELEPAVGRDCGAVSPSGSAATERRCTISLKSL